jgi:hypothetical protein
MDETFFAVPVTLWQSCLTPAAGDIAVFFGGVLFLAMQFAVFQKEQTSIVTTVFRWCC